MALLRALKNKLAALNNWSSTSSKTSAPKIAFFGADVFADEDVDDQAAAEGVAVGGAESSDDKDSIDEIIRRLVDAENSVLELSLSPDGAIAEGTSRDHGTSHRGTFLSLPESEFEAALREHTSDLLSVQAVVTSKGQRLLRMLASVPAPHRVRPQFQKARATLQKLHERSDALEMVVMSADAEIRKIQETTARALDEVWLEAWKRDHAAGMVRGKKGRPNKAAQAEKQTVEEENGLASVDLERIFAGTCPGVAEDFAKLLPQLGSYERALFDSMGSRLDQKDPQSVENLMKDMLRTGKGISVLPDLAEASTKAEKAILNFSKTEFDRSQYGDRLKKKMAIHKAKRKPDSAKLTAFLEGGGLESANEDRFNEFSMAETVKKLQTMLSVWDEDEEKVRSVV